jgi:glycosyltransferase involved in cell wall biosynthesis
LRICVLCSDHSPSDPRVFHREAKTLAQAGHQVTLICPHDKKEEWVDGVRLLGFQGTRSLFLRPLNWLKILSILRHEPADVYHFHDPDLLPVGLALRLLTRKAVVYDCHEWYAAGILMDHRLPVVLRPLLSRLFAWTEETIASWLSAVIVVQQLETEPQFRRVRRLVLLRNFVSLQHFEHLPQLKPSCRQLVYVGVLKEATRGITVLVEALALLHNSDAELVLVGPFGNAQTEKEVLDLIAKKGLKERVALAGRVPYDQVISFLARACIGLLPLRPVAHWRCTVPTKMFEYMACHLPVVASDQPLVRSIIEKTGCGLLADACTPQAFAQAIDTLLDNPEEARRMGEAGYAAVLSEYNWEKESQKLLDLYESLAKER